MSRQKIINWLGSKEARGLFIFGPRKFTQQTETLTNQGKQKKGSGGDGISRFFRIQQGVWADRDTGRVKKGLHMSK
jgi:hypothetical protein